ncbi:MAG: hypothetical protein KGL39_20645 [Patescibacteria group bacterium]|nr:hypothetical protein [Patescibacteria group bacterium]
MLDIAIVILAITATLEAVVIAVLSAVVPATWFRTMRHGEDIAAMRVESAQLRKEHDELRKAVDELDGTVDDTLDAAGLTEMRVRRSQNGTA